MLVGGKESPLKIPLKSALAGTDGDAILLSSGYSYGERLRRVIRYNMKPKRLTVKGSRVPVKMT